MEEGKKHKLGNIATIILFIAACIADALSLIPFVGDLVGPIFWILASIYFWKSGMGLMNPRRLITSAISTVAELIPVVQEFPTIIAGMIIIIVLTRIEDKTGISVTSVAGGGKPYLNSGGVRLPPPKVPLNQGSVRPPSGGLVD